MELLEPSPEISPSRKTEAAMIDQAVMTEEPIPLSEADCLPEPVVALEQRVRRLEDVVAQLQDTRQLEERVVERVAERVGQTHEETLHSLTSAGRQLLPAALALVDAQADSIAIESGHATEEPRRTWLPLEAYAEARMMVRMFLDRRYRWHLSWTVRIVPLVFVGFILTSQWLMPWTLIPVLGTLFDKVLNLVLAFFVYKILIREVRRYRTLVPHTHFPPN